MESRLQLDTISAWLIFQSTSWGNGEICGSPPSGIGMVHYPKSPVQFWTEIKNWFATLRTTFPSFPPGCFHQGFMKPKAINGACASAAWCLTARSFLSTKFRQGQSAGTKCDFQFLPSAAVSFPMKNHWMFDDFSPGFSSNNQLMDKWSPQIVHSEALKRPFTVTTRTLQHLQVRNGAWVIGRHGSVEVTTKRVQACAPVCWYLSNLSFYLSIYSICLSVCLSTYLPTYRPIYLSIYLFIYLSILI